MFVSEKIFIDKNALEMNRSVKKKVCLVQEGEIAINQEVQGRRKTS